MPLIGSKISALRNILEPIHSAIGLHPYWWDKIEKISAKLFATYTGNPDKNWWSKIITEENFGSGEKHFRGKARDSALAALISGGVYRKSKNPKLVFYLIFITLKHQLKRHFF